MWVSLLITYIQMTQRCEQFVNSSEHPVLTKYSNHILQISKPPYVDMFSRIFMYFSIFGQVAITQLQEAPDISEASFDSTIKLTWSLPPHPPAGGFATKLLSLLPLSDLSSGRSYT